jgi:hypothetical protein
MRLIKTAPSIQALTLNFYCVLPDVTSLCLLDWSHLDRLQTEFAGICPRIDLRISGKFAGYLLSHESILDALPGNNALMGLVKRDAVVLKPMLRDEWGEFLLIWQA